MIFKDIFQLLAWELINPVLLRIKKKRTYIWRDSFRGLNIGCGIDNATGWAGIDGGITHYLIYHLPGFITRIFFKKLTMATFYNFNEYSNKIKEISLYHHDIRYGLPFKENTVPNIYSSHFLEHLDEKDGETLLEECFRVMKPKGIIRIVVPSLEDEIEKMIRAIEEYKKGDNSYIQKIVTSNKIGYNSEYSNHKYMYDCAHLKNKLENAGFINIKKCEFRVGNLINVEMLDTRKDSLFVEALRP